MRVISSFLRRNSLISNKLTISLSCVISAWTFSRNWILPTVSSPDAISLNDSAVIWKSIIWKVQQTIRPRIRQTICIPRKSRQRLETNGVIPRYRYIIAETESVTVRAQVTSALLSFSPSSSLRFPPPPPPQELLATISVPKHISKAHYFQLTTVGPILTIPQRLIVVAATNFRLSVSNIIRTLSRNGIVWPFAKHNWNVYH